MGTDTRREAGKRLRAFVNDRMAAGGIETYTEVSERAYVAYDTLHAWFRGRAPTPGTGGKVALVLGTTYSEMLAAYEGGQPAGGRFVTDEQLRALVEAAAEAAVLKVLADRDESERS